MMVGIFVLGFGIWVLSQQPKTAGETEPRPEITPAEFTDYREVERIESVRGGDTYYCIEQRDYVQDGVILFSQWRVQVKGSDNDYTVSTIYEELADAQAKVKSMNQPLSQEDLDKAEEKGEDIPSEKEQSSPFITPTFGGK